MKIVITSATAFETKGIQQALALHEDILFHTSGVGMLSSTYSLTKLLYDQQPQLVVQAGIAGCFDTAIELGTVVVVKEEFVGDMGVDEGDTFNDVFDLELQNKDALPFHKKGLPNPWLPKYNFLQLPEAVGVTINEITTRPKRIEQLKHKYHPLVESMEGAPLHFVAPQAGIPFIQIRVTSNYIGERDKTKWQLQKALTNLQTAVVHFVEGVYKMG